MNQELKRRQSVVYFSDIVGYTRLMGKDEDAAFELMKINLKTHQEIFSKYRGQVVKELGDGILGVFETPKEALRAALEIQEATKSLGKFELRIGMHCGDIIFDHGDVFGDAVNQSSRIQSVGVPSSILISEKLFQELGSQKEFTTVRLGAFGLKNVEKEVELLALTNPPLVIPKRADILATIKVQERKNWKLWAALGIVSVLLISALIASFWDSSIWEKEKSIAVLPFKLVESSEDMTFFAEGITENIIGQLSKIGSLKTISNETTKRIQADSVNLDSLATALDVSTLLRGNVKFLEKGVEIEIQLIDPRNNRNIWIDKFYREGESIPQLQSDIAKAIAKKFDANLTLEEVSQIGKGETSNLEAYNSRLQGNKLYSSQEYEEAKPLLTRAIGLDKNYALAYSDLANAYAQLGDSASLAKSLELSSKALLLEPKLSEGFGARGVAFYYMGKVNAALNSFEQALANNPNQSQALGNIGTVQFSRGKLLDALNYQKLSYQNRPNSRLPYQLIGWIYRILGRNKEGLDWLSKSLEKGKYFDTYELIATTLIKEGKKEEALAVIGKVFEGDSLQEDPLNLKAMGMVLFYLGNFPESKIYYEKSILHYENALSDPFFMSPINLAFIYQKEGNQKTADSLLFHSEKSRLRAIENGMDDYNLYLELATLYQIQNKPNESLSYLEKAFENGWRDLFFVENNPVFESLKAHSEYRKVVEKVKNDHQKVNQQIIEEVSLQRDK